MSRSIAVPLMERTVCTKCGHLHRQILAVPRRDARTGIVYPPKCECCRADWQNSQESSRV